MSKFVSLTDRRIATLQGHVLLFKAREPKEVPAGLETQMLGFGLAPAEALQDEAPVEPAPVPDAAPGFDQAAMEAAIIEVIAKNDPKDLTDKNNPKAKAVSDITGFPVTAFQVVNFVKTLEKD